MRSCTPGNERALSVKTVPRIKKSFAWRYLFLAGLPGVTADACGVAAELSSGGTASWTCPNAVPQEASSPAVERIAIHRAKCTFSAPYRFKWRYGHSRMPGGVGRTCYSSSSSSSESSSMRFRWTGCVCETSSSDSHSGQLRISPSSTSSSSTSISAEHSGQRITAPPSVLSFAKWGYEDRARHYAAYYIPRRVKSTPVRGGTALNVIASWAEGPFE